MHLTLAESSVKVRSHTTKASKGMQSLASFTSLGLLASS